MVRDKMSVSIKSLTGTGIRELTLVTLNDLERRNSPYLSYFAEFDSCAGRLRHSG